MEELDLLKKDWKKNENSFQQVSEKEIYKMIHKKSSSIVKWILAISILEFIILNLIGFLLPDEKREELIAIEKYLNAFTILGYVITLYFIYLFYKNYKSISVVSTTKKLMESILKTRKTVQYYIWYNIVYIFLMVSALLIFEFQNSPTFNTQSNHKNMIMCIISFVLLGFVLGIIWLFYRLLYGILLRRLYANYKELKKIDL
ncbi:hypothetical protein ACMDB5_14005 [Flavobacterium sp. W1B]|uniref:hypothetical protein n=1 Tax=Flavobacterium sp. W1B TaxID=3394146 RepID=UPI0039BCDB32